MMNILGWWICMGLAWYSMNQMIDRAPVGPVLWLGAICGFVSMAFNFSHLIDAARPGSEKP